MQTAAAGPVAVAAFAGQGPFDDGHRRPWPLSAEAFVAGVLGAAHSLIFVHTRFWPGQLLLVGMLVWRLAQATPRRAGTLGLLFGTAWLVAGTWWLYISLHDYGGLPGWIAVLAIALLSGLLSLYLALACGLFVKWRRGRPGTDALLFAALWLLAEMARGVIFTGFPWIASGYAHVDSPLAALAPWTGVYGIGFAAAALAAWPALSLAAGRPGPPLLRLAVVAALLAACSFFGPGRFSQPNGNLTVSLLQGNVPQDQKFQEAEIPRELAWTLAALRSAQGELVVGPETVVPVLPEQLDPDYWTDIAAPFRSSWRAALIGVPLGNPVSGYTNSAAGISAASARMPGGYYRYDKHHLVPFGEFIPLGFHWFTEMMNIPLGDFNRGPLLAPSFVVGRQRIGANICYEDLFGEDLAARFADPAAAPTIFANISNIGWFGDTIAIDQHLQISRMRTLEFQRPMIRATNTGATVVIDHLGRVTHALPRFTRGVLEGSVEGRTGATPFARWASAFGLWLPLLSAGMVIGACAGWRRTQGR